MKRVKPMILFMDTLSSTKLDSTNKTISLGDDILLHILNIYVNRILRHRKLCLREVRTQVIAFATKSTKQGCNHALLRYYFQYFYKCHRCSYCLRNRWSFSKIDCCDFLNTWCVRSAWIFECVEGDTFVSVYFQNGSSSCLRGFICCDGHYRFVHVSQIFGRLIAPQSHGGLLHIFNANDVVCPVFMTRRRKL